MATLANTYSQSVRSSARPFGQDVVTTNQSGFTRVASSSNAETYDISLVFEGVTETVYNELLAFYRTNRFDTIDFNYQGMNQQFSGVFTSLPERERVSNTNQFTITFNLRANAVVS